MQLIKTKKTAIITSVAVLALATTGLTASSDARPRYGKSRHHVAVTAANTAVDDRYAHVVQQDFTGEQPAPRLSRRAARQSQSVAMNTRSFNAVSFGSSGIVDQARRYIGSNPTGRASLWCARFLYMVLERSGRRGTGSDMASSFAHYGQRISGPQVGAIAVMSRGRGGGHVGIITGIDASGNPIMISGNNGNRVREAPISRGRIYAYVMPAG
jgi:uncharacterized protein (TIGR02594 family)